MAEEEDYGDGESGEEKRRREANRRDFEMEAPKPPNSADVSEPRSCRKKKSEDDASFMADLKDHIDEFVNASMDEHKTCFTKTIQKMFGMSKVVAERNSNSSSSSSGSQVESHLPLLTSLTDSN